MATGDRYFTFDDNGNIHWVVARDIPHVHVIFEGITFGDPGRSLGECGFAIEEVSAERAGKIKIKDDDGELADCLLTDCHSGDWFTSEY